MHPARLPCPSASPARRAGAFALLELLTCLAFLVIVLGLMVSLARHVRSGSADGLTRRVLRRLDAALSPPPATAPAGPASPLPPAVPPAEASEAAWAAYAVRSNARVRRLLAGGDPAADAPAADAPVTDAWGNPIAYFPEGRRTIGVAPRDRPFCVSPGPDGRFLTQDDNLYSYEQLPPAAAGGHGE